MNRENRMRAIFISYRREDAEGHAGRLFDDLAAHFGKDSVFMDVVDIEPGRDFRRVIDQQVASCGVLLAVIGKGWRDAKDEAGRRRLDDPGDFVRLETGSALKRDIPVIPVLVHGAAMPRAEDLPQDLQELAYRNGVELTHARWDSDVQVLIDALRPHVGVEQKAARDAASASAPAAGTVGLQETGNGGAPASMSSRGLLVALVAVVVAAGGAAAYYFVLPSKAGQMTGWMPLAEWSEQSKSQPEGMRFPYAFEGRCTAEDRVEVRARFGPLPQGKSAFNWGVFAQAGYERRAAEFASRGFTEFSRQTCVKASGDTANMSVWVK